MPNQSEWGLAETKRIKYMTEAEATDLMNEYDLPNDTRQYLWPFVGSLRGSHAATVLDPTPPSPPPTEGNHEPTKSKWKVPDPDRPLWLASAWLCGASHSALAFLLGVSEQAVQQSINRLMPSAEERHSHRLGYRLGLERVEELRLKYYSNVHKLRGMTPVECSVWLTQEEEDA